MLDRDFDLYRDGTGRPSILACEATEPERGDI
jgi:hypothetical protein